MTPLGRSYKDYLNERLRDPTEAADYINGALEEDDTAGLLLALRDVAEARGVGKVAAKAGLNRENVYRMLSDQGNPRLGSMMALFRALGIQLQVKSQSGQAEGLEPEGFVNLQSCFLIENTDTENSGPTFPRLVEGSPSEDYESDYASDVKPAAA